MLSVCSAKKELPQKGTKKRKKNTKKIRDQIQGIAIIGLRIAFEFPPTLAASCLALFCDLCALLRLFPFFSPAPKHSHPTFFFCAFCALLRLFPSYLSAYGFQPQVLI
jgi:hypothetical protein